MRAQLKIHGQRRGTFPAVHSVSLRLGMVAVKPFRRTDSGRGYNVSPKGSERETNVDPMQTSDAERAPAGSGKPHGSLQQVLSQEYQCD